MGKDKKTTWLWLARVFIGTVTFFNFQAALVFLIHPEVYAPGFELSGIAGSAMIRGVGLLFLMWNIPYLVALIHPLKHYVSTIEAVLMQTVGVIGESVLLLTLPGEHPQLQASVIRFIIFDGSGLILLLAALACVFWLRKHDKNPH